MVRVYLGLGSNCDRERYLLAALDALSDQFGELLLSSVFESQAVGFDGDAFLNMVVGIDTRWSVSQLSGYLKALEDRHGRRRDCPRYSGRTLDIDILTYAQQSGVVDGVTLPRGEIVHNAFVLWPLAELAPDDLHPLLGQRYAELWQRYDRKRQQLWPVSFSWRGKQLTRFPTDQVEGL